MFKKPTKTEIREMIRVATEARENAFAHRSKHKIGASVLTGSGEIFGGCNIESVISGLGTCAERCAIDHAIVHGHYNLRAVCTIDSGYTPSCGACLQYTLLFSQVADHEIYMINGDVEGNYEIEQLSNLIPEGYRTKNNLEAIRSYGKKELIKPKRTKRKKL
jgi:cytidine deaminase